MVDTTWTNGGGDGKASTAANWSNGIDVGYNVIFDGTSTANCTFDYDGQLGAFTIAAGYTGTITQSSDMYISGYSQAGGTFIPKDTSWVYCGGNFVKTSGTITNYLLRLNIINDCVINIPSVIGYHTLFIANDTIVTITSNGNAHNIPNLINYGILNIGDFTPVNILCFMYYSTTVISYQNSGVINSLVTTSTLYGLNFLLRQSDVNLDLGCIINNVNFKNVYDVASPSIFLISNISINGTINLFSTVPRDITFDLNGHSLTASSITVGTRGVLANSAATDSVIACNSFDSSAGTFTEANTQVVLKGNGTLKTGAHKFDELVQRDNVTTTLGSDITVTNEFDTAGSFIQGAYSITHENPEKRLIAPMVNPIMRTPKRSPFFNNRFTKNIEIEVI